MNITIRIKFQEKLITLRLFYIYFVLIFLSGCAGKEIKQNFHNNIKEFYDFFEENRDRDIFVKNKTQQHIKHINKKASINAKNTKISVFLSLLSKVYETDINYSIGNKETIESNLRVTLSMNDVSLEEIMDALLEEFDFNIKKNSSGYVIWPRQVITEIININHHNFQRIGKSSVGVSNSRLNIENAHESFSSISSETEGKFWDNLESIISTTLSLDVDTKQDEDIGFSIHRESGVLVVNGYPKQIHNIKRILNRLNLQSTRQVLLEIKILEVELKEEFQKGIQWNTSNNNLRYSNINNDAYYYQLNASDGLINNTLTTKITGGIDAVVNTLYSQAKVSIISSQRLMVLNNERGFIKSGSERFFVTNITNLRLSSQNQTEEESGIDLVPFFSGVALDTTINIVNDRDILMHIHPMITRVMEEEKTITMNSKKTVLPVAMIQSRETDTVIKASNGELVILGGLAQNRAQLSKSGLPINSEKSFINKILDFFSSKRNANKQVDVILIIKPTIVNGV